MLVENSSQVLSIHPVLKIQNGTLENLQRLTGFRVFSDESQRMYRENL